MHEHTNVGKMIMKLCAAMEALSGIMLVYVKPHHDTTRTAKARICTM